MNHHRSRTPTHEYACPNCGQEHTFDIEPFVPGNISGPPENCYPDEDGNASGPEECESCGQALKAEDVYIEWEEKMMDHEDEPREDE